MNDLKEQFIEEWLETHLGNEVYTPGFERLGPFLKPLKVEITHRKIKIITIAGTNGKGETAHTLSFLLNQAGIPHTLWTSPHLVSVRERFQYNQQLIVPEELLTLFTDLEQELKNSHLSLSYYEFLLVIFVRFSLLRPIQVIVFEVGLGGKWDGVNFFDADITAITSIARDHQQILGRDLKQILQEKLGITRPHKPLITCLELEYLRTLTKNHALAWNIPWQDLFLTLSLPLQTSFKKRNHFLALSLKNLLLEEKPLSLSELEETERLLNKVHFKGRGETLLWEKMALTFYGSHNVDGIRKLVQFLCANGYNKKKFGGTLFSLSKRDEAEVKTILDLLTKSRGVLGKLMYVSFKHPKALDLPPTNLEARDIICLENWYEDLPKIPLSEVLVTGSYYFVGTVQQALGNRATS